MWRIAGWLVLLYAGWATVFPGVALRMFVVIYSQFFAAGGAVV